MAADLSVETFAPKVGESFKVDVGEAGELELKLVAANSNPGDGSMPRQPFSLTFSGPPDRILAQGTFRFAHSELGTLEIFVVPVGRDENGATYEAIFA